MHDLFVSAETPATSRSPSSTRRRAATLDGIFCGTPRNMSNRWSKLRLRLTHLHGGVEALLVRLPMHAVIWGSIRSDIERRPWPDLFCSIHIGE
jgi:hypothetical protein